MLVLASGVNATDTAMNCTQQGFQVSAEVGCGITTPSNTVYGFPGLVNTGAAITQELNDAVAGGDGDGIYDISTLGLDYSNISTWQSDAAMMAGVGLGYKWMLNCNQYSVTTKAFVQYNGVSMNSALTAQQQSFQVGVTPGETIEDPATAELIGGVGATTQYAGNVTLASGGPVFGFSVLLAKEFNWGNAGLLLGMKFNPYRLTYLQTKAEVVSEEGIIGEPGFLDTTGQDNDTVGQDIAQYVEKSSKTQIGTGFTVGFATNYYIADNLSAGFTLFYDMYAPIKFNVENINISPYVGAEGDSQVTDSGNFKFQNNTMGIMMNLTYSFGAN